MNRVFKYDVAITAADFDALAAEELKRRLEHRLSKAVYAAPRVMQARPASPTATTATTATTAAPATTAATTAATAAAAHKVIEKDARVVVVLFQRLWGSTASPASAAECAAVKARIGKVKRKDVIIVPLDNSPLPVWLKGTIVKGSETPTSAAVIDAIIEAVDAAGGSPKRLTEAAIAAREADEEKRARARISFLSSQRALALINRELDALSNTVLRLCQTPGTLPDGLAPEMRRTPDRYTVQIGPVGLSFSWIRGRSNSIADGQLLVIEWSGHLGERRPEMAPQTTAMPACENVLQPHATSPEDWQWRRADLDLCAYTTGDLAAQCVASVVRRLPATA